MMLRNALRSAVVLAAVLCAAAPADAETAAGELRVDGLSVGPVTITCRDPGAWMLSTETRRAGDGTEELTLRFAAPAPAVPPKTRIDFDIPRIDMHNRWSAIPEQVKFPPIDFWDYVSTGIANGIPVVVILDGRDRNRIALAVSEARRNVTLSGYAKEEGSRMAFMVELFKEPEAPIASYAVTLRIDRRDLHFSDAVRSSVSWIERANGFRTAHAPKAAFEPLYSTWYAFHQQMTDGEIEAECAEAAKLGLKAVIVDDGWQTDDAKRGYAFTGDWEASKRRFPDMAAHVKRVHDLGMKYLVWFGVPQMGFKSKNYERFKGKYLWRREGRWSDYACLDPRFPEVREFLAGLYAQRVREWDLDGLKLDFIDSFSFFEPDPAVAENYAGRDIRSLPEAVDRLLADVTERLKALKPDILVEFRQTYIGPAIRQYGNMLRAADCPGDLLANRCRTANLRLTSGNTAVHSDMIEWNDDETPEGAARHLIAAIFSTIQSSVMLRTIPAAHKRMLAHWLGFSVRHREALLKGGFRPHGFAQYYPWIESWSDKERIAAVYAPGAVAEIDPNWTIPADRGEIYVLDGTGTGQLVLRSTAEATAEVYDTYGDLHGVCALDAGLNDITLPESGYLRIYSRERGPHAEDLSGNWRLALDGAESGVVTLPGTLDESARGTPNPVSDDTTHLARRCTFAGTAEYSRTFVVPQDWEGHKLRLTLELVHDATVLVDGREVGADKSISTPHVHEFGPLAPGEHTLAVRVRTPGDFPKTVGGQATDPNTQTDWNGILGKMMLEPVPAAEFRNVRIRTDAAARRIAVEFETTSAHPQEGCRSFAVTASPENFSGRAFSREFPLVPAGVNRITFDLGAEAALWDEFKPNLYRLRIAADGFAIYETTFGLRDFSVAGRQFAVNGKPVFLRGRHDAGVFPLTAHQPTDIDSWMKHLGKAKKWGLNYVRFHSWCPCEAAFMAADKLGIYLQPELPFWGWLGIPDGKDNPLAVYLAEEGRRILDAYGNHPSFVQFALGNEINGNEANLEALAMKLKAHDSVDGKPRRLMTDGSNNHLGKEGWQPWMDYFTTCRTGKEPWGSTSTHVRASFAYVDADKGGILATVDPNSTMTFDGAAARCPIPVIGHETGQYQAYPDFSEIKKYTGVLRPDNLRVFKRRLEEAGLGGWGERFHRDSGRWAAELYKADIEMNLRSAQMAGFQLLDLQDYPGQGTALVGVLDAFMEPKGQVDREIWRGFCSEVVPLARLEKFTFDDGEKATLGLSVCDYSERGLKDAKLKWQLVRETAGVRQQVAAGESAIAADGRGLKNLGEVPLVFSLRDPKKAERLTLELSVAGTSARNTYPVWVYPAKAAPEPENLLVTATLDAAAERTLAAGGAVLWIPPADAVAKKSVGGLAITDYWNYRMFKTVSENAKREVSPGTLGLTLDPSHPIFDNFPTESHASWQWARILRGSRPLILDGLAADVPVRVIDNVERNHSLALVAGWSVGKGRLLVASTDFDSPLVDNPEGRAWRAAVARYAASDDFKPASATTLEALRAHFATAASESSRAALDNNSNYKD